MNNSIWNRAKSKLEWISKRMRLASYGCNCHVGYDLVLKNPQNIYIGDNFSAGKNLTLETWEEYEGKINTITPILKIGSNVSIMDNCQFSCASKITVGNGVLFGNNVFVTDNFHGKSSIEELSIPPVNRDLYIKGNVYIGDNAWIGRNVCIMPGVNIGNGAVIGANAVVTKDIPAYSIGVGVPATIVKEVKPYE